MIVALLCLIIGGALGYYGQAVYKRLEVIAADRQDKREAREVGVVRVVGIPATRNQPLDMTSETGGVRKPTPAEIENLRLEDRARILRENHQ